MTPFLPSGPGLLQGLFARSGRGSFSNRFVPQKHSELKYRTERRENVRIRPFFIYLNKSKGIVFRVIPFIFYNLIGGYKGMSRQELIIMLAILLVGVCLIALTLFFG